MGTQVAFKTAKIIYVRQPMLRIAGGVMYTMMKLHIQFAAVDMEEPFWRALRGRISDGYTCNAKCSSQYSSQTSLRVALQETYPDSGLEADCESSLEDE